MHRFDHERSNQPGQELSEFPGFELNRFADLVRHAFSDTNLLFVECVVLATQAWGPLVPVVPVVASCALPLGGAC